MKTQISSERDFLLRAASPFLIFGAFATPALVFRAAGFTIGDFALLVGSVLVVISAAPRPPRQPIMQVAVILAVVGAAVAATVTADVTEHALVAFRLLFIWTVLQFAIRKWATGPEKVTSLATAFVLGAALSGAVAIGQAFFGVGIEGTEILNGRVPGLALHVNGQGGLMAVAAPLATGLALSRVRPWLNFGAAGLIAIGLVLSGSVTGMMCAGIGIVAVFIVQRVRFGRALLSAAVVAAVIVVALNVQASLSGSADPFQRFADTTGQGEGQSTLALRVLTYEYAWSRIGVDPFFGVGMGTTTGGTYDGVTQTHNMFLLFWFQGGLFLLVALILVLIHTARRFAGAKRMVPRGPLLASVVAAFAFAMTGPVVFERWFWLPFVLAWALPRVELAKPAIEPAPSVTAYR